VTEPERVATCYFWTHAWVAEMIELGTVPLFMVSSRLTPGPNQMAMHINGDLDNARVLRLLRNLVQQLEKKEGAK
jgi:hypothetical protein